MKKILLFLLLTLQLASCQNHNSNNKNINEPQYDWGVAVNVPIGYPIRFYAAMVGGTPIQESSTLKRRTRLGKCLWI